MFKPQLLYCVTDKELFDLLKTSKQSIPESTLLGIARDRGIFYAPQEPRDTLVSALSLLPYGYQELEAILDYRATAPRVEKRTSVTLQGAITVEDIKAVCAEYRESAPEQERVNTVQDGTSKVVATVNYSELDYTKTRLLQRREKEADLEFIVKEGETVVRMPANDKSREITTALREALEKRLCAQISTDEIEVSGLKTPELRTSFFTSLIANMPGYTIHDVMDVKIESKLYDPDEDLMIGLDGEELGLSEEDQLDAKQAMMSVVENITLKGSSLLNTSEYQQLREKGYYIASILWKAKQTTSPNDIFEFEAGFDKPREGTGFKYLIRGFYRDVNGTPLKTMRQIPKEARAGFFALIERTARSVLSDLLRDDSSADRAGA